MAEDIDIEEAEQRLEAGAYLLDVREQDEWDNGHAPQASHIAMSVIAASHDSLPKDQEILVICKAGGRSAQVVAFLEREGYKAANIDGGMLAWQAIGRPITDSQGNTGMVV
jgi:rhodanese-related sulfurtransferase